MPGCRMRASRGTLSPEPPGIYRFPVNPAGGRPGQPRLPKPAVFESTTALGLLPSRALSSGRTPETLSPPIHLPSQGCRWSGMPESLGLSAVPYDTMRPYALSTPFHYPLLLNSSKITHSLGRRRANLSHGHWPPAHGSKSGTEVPERHTTFWASSGKRPDRKWQSHADSVPTELKDMHVATVVARHHTSGSWGIGK